MLYRTDPDLSIEAKLSGLLDSASRKPDVQSLEGICLATLKYLTTLILIIYLCGLSQAVFASAAADVHGRLQQGGLLTSSDLDAVNEDLAKDKLNPLKLVAAGEALAHLGFFTLAADQYAAADKIKPDYVLNEFKKVFENNHFIPELYFQYLQAKYPRDPAVLLYAIRRNLQSPKYTKEQKSLAIATAKKELDMALSNPHPWPETYATLSMIEYNEGKLDLAIHHSEIELKDNPESIMAQKVRILSLRKKGYSYASLEKMLKTALKASAQDDDLNLFLGRAYILKGDYQAAVKPSLYGFFYQYDTNTLNEARDQVFDLIKNVNHKKIMEVLSDLVMSEPGTDGKGFRATVMVMRIAELFSIAGYRDEACQLLTVAIKMNPRFKAAVAYKLGRELVLMHRYFDAYPYLQVASMLARNPEDKAKFEAMAMRVARVGLNSDRDIAGKIKGLIRSAKH